MTLSTSLIGVEQKRQALWDWASTVFKLHRPQFSQFTSKCFNEGWGEEQTAALFVFMRTNIWFCGRAAQRETVQPCALSIRSDAFFAKVFSPFPIQTFIFHKRNKQFIVHTIMFVIKTKSLERDSFISSVMSNSYTDFRDAFSFLQYKETRICLYRHASTHLTVVPVRDNILNKNAA